MIDYEAAVYIVAWAIMHNATGFIRFPKDNIECICIQLWAEHQGLA